MDIGGIVLGSFLASFLQVLFDKLTSPALNYAQRKGISTTLPKEWEKMLVKIKAMLADAEDKQLSGNHQVELWLDSVRDLAYDMDDLVDEFEIKVTQVESEAESSTCRGLEKLKFLFDHPRSLVSITKIQEIDGRLATIVTEMASLSLRENVAIISNYTSKRDPTTSLPEHRFFGREEERAHIFKLLTNEAGNSDATLGIVPIVGMGGIGKTALAQLLYDDVKVTGCFDKKAWVCVSDNFDVFNITKNILHSITKKSLKDEDLNELQNKLRDSLSQKKFLVVLDDVWNDNYERWTTLLRPFKAGAKGSKIIITARNLPAFLEKEASLCVLKELPLNDCANLLAFHAFEEVNFESHPELETIGKNIAETCKGLPLAAKMLGGALRYRRELGEWEDTLNKITGGLPTAKNEVLPILKLSYVHLPSYLKRCFSYCAVFPKGYEIERDELVLLWIVEGFLDQQKTKENNLGLGRSYFNELVSRSFLQQSSVDASKFSMHDLLNDLAKSIEGGTCFTSGEFQLATNEDDPEKVRYASFISSQFVTSKCLREYHKMKVLRSLILARVGSSKQSLSISNTVLHDLLTNLKYLRVFSLCHCNIEEVPDRIADLKHLRYLNFSYTNIERLPESIVGLCKLQALILRGCQNLSKLPQGITKLVSLQFLDIRDTEELKEMPLGIGNLKNLTILSKFVVGTDKGSQLKELKNLSHLQRELFILELQRVKGVTDAVAANLSGKKGLSNLFLHWDEAFGNRCNDEHNFKVLQSLRPHTNLRNLTILNYGGAKFPSWLDGSSYSNVVSLCLRGCLNVTSLPSLGQLPSLRELSLEGLNLIIKIDSKFYGGKSPFSSLTTLKFEEMLTWKDWSPYAGGAEEKVPFYCLQHLVVRNCPSLIGTLPCQFDRLIKLEIHSCPHLNNSTDEVCLPSLDELYLEDCSKEILKSFSLVKLTSLTILKIYNLGELVCFDHGFMSYLVKLKKLHIGRCNKLIYLWQDGNETRNLTCLQELVIESCPQFISFVAREGEIELPCSNNMGLNIPQDDPSNNNPMPQLESIEIRDCKSLTSVSLAKGRLAPLKALLLNGCKGVKSLEDVTSESIETMRISYCENLHSLPQSFHMLSHLSHLDIYYCLALEIEDFPPLPITLSSLQLSYCPKIKSIAGCNIDSCDNLTELKIWDCLTLEIEDFPLLPVSLSSLTLWTCPKIKSLPNQWHHLTSLRLLMIQSCQNITCLPKGGLPSNLRELEIMGCENLKQPLREWGLPLLTSLQELTIDGTMGGEGEKLWFPSEEEDAWSLLFPPSLTSLSIFSMRNVERLSSGLHNHLSSLQWLLLADCPKLRELPKDGLPPSLRQLRIFGCKILEDRCSKHIGDYWPLIREIPQIWTDDYHIGVI